MRAISTHHSGPTVSGEIVSLDLTLTAKQAADLHTAFGIFDELARVIRTGVVPALGGAGHPAVTHLCDLLRDHHLYSAGIRSHHRFTMEQARQEVRS